MSLHQWLIYVSVVLAVIVTPGPSAILCMSHGAAHGPVRATATIVGGMCASLSLMLLSALGLSAAIAASDLLFHGIKYAGATYLVYLGIQTWRSPFPTAAASASEGSPRLRLQTSALFRKGFIVGIGNPKDLLFFGSLFPQFIDSTQPIAVQLVGLAVTWLAIDGLAMCLYAKFGAVIAPQLARRRVGKMFNRVTGGLFVAVGGAIAASNR